MLSTTTKVLTVLTLFAASVSSVSIGHPSNNLAHKRHAGEVTHNAVLQARAARRRDMSDFAKIAAEQDVAKRSVKKRGTNARRCAMKSSSSAFASATATSTDSSSSAEPTSTSVEPTSTAAETTKAAKKATTSAEPTTTASPTKTKTSSSAAATTTQSSSNDDGGSSSGDVTTGQATFYATGLGACGITNKDTDFICAVSHLLFDGFEGYTGGDPNSNPICGKKIKATYQGKSVTVTVTDRCVGCAAGDLDFAPSAFDQLANEDLGRLSGMTWQFV